jgi:uncharacterized RDD family membrane protein YckC/ribosomal protein L40E
LATISATFRFAGEAAAIECARPEAPLRVPSAAQNVTVIQTCLQCGAINGPEARTCCLCDTRLSKNPDAISVPAPTGLRSEGNLAVEPDWRSEVFQRVDAYNARRGRPRENRLQPELAFAQPVPSEPAEARAVEARPEIHSVEAAPTTIATRRFRPARVERLEIEVEQPSFDFTGHSAHIGPKTAVSSYDSAVPSVAPLLERRRAGALDFAFLLFAYAGFLMLFHSLGGRFSLSRFDALVTVAALGLLYAQYVALFTYYAQATPGMMLRGLRVTSLDGLDASPRQLLWRSLGYLVSAGAMMLGFLWTLWDEDQLSWHDRISQTCITTDVVPMGEHCGQPNATH